MRIAIVADDLTGAGDAAAPFARRGLKTVVELEAGSDDEGPAEVVALDTDTRGLAPRSAAARTSTAVAALRRRGAETLFKKVDSTLRGNLAAELRACLRSWPADLAVLCPAFPSQGRWVQNGHLLVDGRGDLGPVTELAGLGARDRVEHLPGDVLARGARDVELLLRGARGLGSRIVIADATSPRDLATLVAGAARVVPALLLAGSAGLSDAVAERAVRDGGPEPTAAGPRQARAEAPWLVVAGSQASVTVEQIVQLRRAGGGVVDAPAGDLLQDRRLARRIGAEAARMLSGGQVAAIKLVVEAGGAELSARAERSLARALGRACRAALEQQRPGGLFLTGGATARACLLAIGARAIALEDEPLPGFARGRVVDGAWDGMTVVTKAGGFGAPDAIRRLVT